MPEAAEVVEAQEVHCKTLKLHMRILAVGVRLEVVLFPCMQIPLSETLSQFEQWLAQVTNCVDTTDNESAC